jgi:hypothetical protein
MANSGQKTSTYVVDDEQVIASTLVKMHRSPEVRRCWEMRHPQFMNSRDATISFNCYEPDFIEVNELINGEIIHSQIKKRHRDAVTEIETKYIFFADEADTARKMVSGGRSCLYNVYFREP